MNRLVLVGALSVGAVVLAAGALGAQAKEIGSFTAALTVKQEVPRPKAPATAAGTFSATVTVVGQKQSIRWKLTFRSLTGKAVAAHIHKGKAGIAGGVVLALCGPCKSGQIGSAPIRNDVVDLLERARAYVNVHTAKNPAGEIRGQTKLVGGAAPSPGPATTPTPAPPPPTDTGGYGY
jgi:hypothetical protein